MPITAAHGSNSRDLRIASREDILNHDIYNALMLAVHAYVKEAHDFSTSPDETWRIIRDGVLNADLRSLLIIYAPGGDVGGFMYCRMDDEEPGTAVIHSAYAASGTDKSVIGKSLALFEDWARFHKATKARFYTFRVPGAHRSMMAKGWKHVITSYKKEL